MTLVEILTPIVHFIMSIILDLGYGGFLLMVLESALIPIPSEIIMPFSGFLVTTGSLGSIGVILAGSLGNLVGSIGTYFLGIKLGRAFLIKYGRYIFFRPKHLFFYRRVVSQIWGKDSFRRQTFTCSSDLCFTSCRDWKDKFLQVRRIYFSRIIDLEYDTYIYRNAAWSQLETHRPVFQIPGHSGSDGDNSICNLDPS
jgi:hypothetical protein